MTKERKKKFAVKLKLPDDETFETELEMTPEDMEKIQQGEEGAAHLLFDSLAKANAKRDRKTKKIFNDIVDKQIRLVVRRAEEVFGPKIAEEVEAFLTRKTQHLRGPEVLKTPK